MHIIIVILILILIYLFPHFKRNYIVGDFVLSCYTLRRNSAVFRMTEDNTFDIIKWLYVALSTSYLSLPSFVTQSQ